MFGDSYGTRHRQSWQDAMQVCLNGHVINAGVRKNPQRNKDFCDSCGEQTITTCPNCNKPIPGDLQDTGVVAIGFLKSAPKFCEHCGEKFPWTHKAEAQHLKEEAEKPIEALQGVFSKFNLIARRLRQRYNGRNTLNVSDEYDVQDLLSALLILYFDDIRREEPTPSFAGKSSRIDFLLKKEEIGVEVKMTRQGLADKEVRDQLIIDIESYKEHPDCNTLICFIYDPEGWIANPTALIEDLQSQSRDDLEIIVVIESS